MITAYQASHYLERYIRRYRTEYERFTAPSPSGGGYPAIPVSPYVYGSQIECHVATDGAVVLDSSRVPPYEWTIAGGPAIMADFPDTRTPDWVTAIITSSGLPGKPIGIYRVVSQTGIPQQIWTGDLGKPVDQKSSDVDGLQLDVLRYRYGLRELLRRLTFGAFELILDLNLLDADSDFWNPRIIRDLGFFPADRSTRRFVHYAEILLHTDRAAWDTRSIWMRAHVDVRRDFASAVSAPLGGGTLSYTAAESPVGPPFTDRLEALRTAAGGLETLLTEHGDAPESVFHDYIHKHAVLLDVYGHAESKPRLTYPGPSGPTGKFYVEPDFILRYWNQTYRFVELERPSHAVATQEGHPRVPVTHAAYQIAEWRDFINNHYSSVQDRYPGIVGNCSSTIVISRSTQQAFTGVTDRNRYIGLLRQQLAIDEILTYDDLVTKAREALGQLASLAEALSSYPPSSDSV